MEAPFMYEYPAVFEADAKDGGFVVRFPDFGWGATQGDTVAEAMNAAADLLETLIGEHIRKKEALPPQSKPQKGMKVVHLPILVDAKVSLYYAMKKAGVRKAELARRLGVQKSQIER